MVERLKNKKHDIQYARIFLTTNICIIRVFANTGCRLPPYFNEKTTCTSVLISF